MRRLLGFDHRKIIVSDEVTSTFAFTMTQQKFSVSTTIPINAITEVLQLGSVWMVPAFISIASSENLSLILQDPGGMNDFVLRLGGCRT